MNLAEEIYKKIYFRDNGKCILCKSKTNIECHHIIPRSQFSSKDIDRDLEKNLCILCRGCHNNAHTKTFRTILLESLKKKYKYDYSMNPWAKFIKPSNNADPSFVAYKIAERFEYEGFDLKNFRNKE